MPPEPLTAHLCSTWSGGAERAPVGDCPAERIPDRTALHTVPAGAVSLGAFERGMIYYIHQNHGLRDRLRSFTRGVGCRPRGQAPSSG